MSVDTSTVEGMNARSIISASNYIGGSTAAAGGTFGAAYATLKGRPVVLWTVYSGLQCGALGWTFWGARSLLCQSARHDAIDQTLTARQEILYSTAAGSLSGIVGGAFRGRANILPGAIFMGLVGLGGQLGYNTLNLNATQYHEKRPLLDRLSDSKWWPLKALSDEDYEKDLTEKIIAIEAEVSMIDDRLNDLKGTRASVNKTT